MSRSLKLVHAFLATALLAGAVVAGSSGDEPGESHDGAVGPLPEFDRMVSRRQIVRPEFPPGEVSDPRRNHSTPLRAGLPVSVHVTGTYPDIPLYPNPGHQQTELSVAMHPTLPGVLLAGSNSAAVDLSAVSQGWYYTTDAVASWIGGDTLPLHSDLTYSMTDPAVAIDADGYLFFNAIRYRVDADAIIDRSTDGGLSWTRAVVPDASAGEDKNHLVIDTYPGSPFTNNVYTAYTDFGVPPPAPIVFSRSTDRGLTFSAPTRISGGAGKFFSQGVNLAVAPGGTLYAAWSGYDNFPPDSTRLGFTRSTDGGLTWDPARTVRWVRDLRGFLGKGADEVRLNSYPILGVDGSDGPRQGWVYAVYAEKSPVRPDVFLIRSTDGGETWSLPRRVNQDTTGNDQWLPWLAVDPTTGGVFVAYYDSRRFLANDSAEVWLSMSYDGGDSFHDVRVSDLPFLPRPIPGLADGYMGDYIGITARDGVAWPVWNDDRVGNLIYQAYTARVETVDFGGAPQIRVSQDSIDFGTVFVGFPATRMVTVRNFGFPDTLYVNPIVSSDPEFTSLPAGLVLAGGQHGELEVIFDPTADGPSSGWLLLASNDPSRPVDSVLVQGLALEPPVLVLKPDTLGDSLEVGDSATQTVVVRNEGGSDLHFVTRQEPYIAALRGEPDIQVTPGARPSPGWGKARLQPSPPAATATAVRAPSLAAGDTDFVEIALDPAGDGGVVDITRILAHVNAFSMILRLEFVAPVSPDNFGGYVSLDVDQDPATGVPPSFGTSGQEIGAEFEVYLFSLGSEKVSLVDESGTHLGYFDATVSDRTVEFAIPLSVLDGDEGFIDLTSTVGDAAGPTDWIPDLGFATVPGIGWLAVDPASGAVPPGDSLVITTHIDTRGLVGGVYRKRLVLDSNDPAMPQAEVPVVLQVTGIPKLALDRDTLRFDSAYVGFQSTAGVRLGNVGTDLLWVTELAVEPPVFAVDPTAFVVAPRRDTTIYLNYSAVGEDTVTGLLSILSNDPTLPVLSLVLTGAARPAPELRISRDTTRFAVRQGDRDSTHLLLTNLGPGTLTWRAQAVGVFGGVSLKPAEGLLSAADSVRISVVIDALGLPGGDLTYALRLQTNDPRSTEISVPLVLSVLGIGPGDATADFRTDIRDIIYLVNVIFKEGPDPHPGTGDLNCDGGVTVSDVMFLIEFVFLGGPDSSCR